MPEVTHLPWDLGLVQQIMSAYYPHYVGPRQVTALCGQRVNKGKVVGESPTCPRCLGEIEKIRNTLP